MKNIRELLSEYNNFEECIIEDVKFSNLLTDIEIIFNYVWDNSHQIRKNLDYKKTVVLKLNSIKEFKIENILLKAKGFSENLNWSYNEIAIIKTKETNGFTELNILWESDRKIIILFSGEISIE